MNSFGIIFEVDPLTCPKCFSKIKVISVIEDEEIIKKILKHLALWDKKSGRSPKSTGPPKIEEHKIDYVDFQLPITEVVTM